MRPRIRTWTLLLIAAIGFVAALFWVRANPSQEKDPLTEAQETIDHAFGMTLAQACGPEGGLPVEAIEPNGPAAGAGIEVGDRVVAINDESVWHAYQFIEALNKRATSSPVLPLLVERDGDYRVVVFKSSGELPVPGEVEGHHH